MSVHPNKHTSIVIIAILCEERLLNSDTGLKIPCTLICIRIVDNRYLLQNDRYLLEYELDLNLHCRQLFLLLCTRHLFPL